MLTLVASGHYEVNTPASASVTITSDDRPPDLIVASVTAPPAAAPGATITVTDTTLNQATVPSPELQTGFYLSSNSVLDAQDVLLGNRAVSNLAPGASESQSTGLQLPVTTAVGTYYVIAKADWNDAVVETLETNNARASGPIAVTGPDLMLTALAAPATGAPGGVVTVSDTTKNSGGGSTASSFTAFYLSADGVWDAADVRLGSRSVPTLASGASHPGSTLLTIPASTAAGSYYIVGRADDAGTIAESQENNNLRFAGMVRIGADLAITVLTAPGSAAAGASIVLTHTTTNQGTGTADASTIGFYLSLNALLDAQDVLIGNRPVSTLAPGSAESQSTSVQVPATTAVGAYYVIAKADWNNAVLEFQETNNTRASGQILVGPDLTVAAVAAPATAAAGSVLTVTDTTKNNGGDSASASLTAFYLSANGTWDATDVRLGSRAVSVLAPGASHAGSTVVTIPASITPGSYYIVARADDAGGIVETLESNNVRVTGLVKIGAELTVTAITAPASAAAGASIPLSDSTTNQGGAAAGPSTTAFYLSSNSIFDASDVRLGARMVPSLAPGVGSSASTTLTLPAATSSGVYYVIARADDTDAVAETSETNNTRTSAAVKVGPDLTVTRVAAPATAGAGYSMNVTETVSNIGAAASVSTEAVLYLSANGAIDAGDVVLATRTVPPLAAGATHAASFTVTVPASTITGTYYVLEQIDAGNVVGEAAENNNTGSSSFIRIGPDLTITALSGPASVAVGTSAALNETTTNSGGGTADGSTTTFFLSTNLTFDALDLPLGSRSVAALPAGSLEGAATSLAFPATLVPGTYYIFAKADATGAVAETYETNNIRVTPITVVAP
jgi:subtilase family serine protease